MKSMSTLCILLLAIANTNSTFLYNSNTPQQSDALSFCLYNKKITIDWHQLTHMSTVTQAIILYLNGCISESKANIMLKAFGALDIRAFLAQALLHSYRKDYKRAPGYLFPTSLGSQKLMTSLTGNQTILQAAKGLPFLTSLYAFTAAASPHRFRKRLFHLQEAFSALVNSWHFQASAGSPCAKKVFIITHALLRPAISLYLCLTNPEGMCPLWIENIPDPSADQED